MSLPRVVPPPRRAGASVARALVAVCVVALGVPTAHLGAQVASATRVEVENDFFDFRRPPIRRPDHNYTHGTKLSAGVPGALGWGRFAGTAAPCGAGNRASGQASPCTSTIVEVGQMIFTPTHDSPAPLPGERPYAGWLYATLAARAESGRRLRTVTVTAGVTGPASLGRATHLGFHELKPKARIPLGWGHQLPNELAGSVGYTERKVAVEVGRRGRPAAGRLADLVPSWGFQVGTVRTSMAVGARTRVGWNLSHPWRDQARGADAWELYAVSGLRGEWVLRDLFLDGSTFAPSQSVERAPLVSQVEWGAGLRVHRLALEYRLVTQSREYRTGPERHAYGVISATWLRPVSAPGPGPLVAGRHDGRRRGG